MKLISKLNLGNLKGAVYQDSNLYYLYKIRGLINGKRTVINISYVYYDSEKEAMKALKDAMECMTLQKELIGAPYL